MSTREEERTGFKIFERVCLSRLVRQCLHGSFGPSVKCINRSRKSYVTFPEKLECPDAKNRYVTRVQDIDGENFHFPAVFILMLQGVDLSIMYHVSM